MRIFLTGSKGQVGGALLPLLQKRGEVIAPDLPEFNLTDSAALSSLLNDLKPDLIINPAAYTAVDRAEDEPELAMKVNGEAPAELAKWAARHQVPLVHFSTDYVFDGSGEQPRKEDDPTGPLSVYGKTKLAGEVAVRSAGGPHLVIRTSWVFDSSGANFLRTIARLAGERTELRIVADQMGAPTSAPSIAAAVDAMLPADLSAAGAAFAKAQGLVHFTNSGVTSFHGFATSIVDGLRSRGVELKVQSVIPIRTDEFPTKAVRPRNSRLDLSRLRKEFGIQPISWEDAVKLELDKFCQASANVTGR